MRRTHSPGHSLAASHASRQGLGAREVVIESAVPTPSMLTSPSARERSFVGRITPTYRADASSGNSQIVRRPVEALYFNGACGR